MKGKFLKRCVLGLLLALVIALTGCASKPDPVEDPLSAFDVDAVLPFATVAPEAAAPTPVPTPTVNPDDLLTDPNYGQEWRQEGGEEDTGWLDDVEEEPAPTPRPTARPTTRPTERVEEEDAGYTRLSYGSSGTAVKNLQRRLKALGYYNGSVDGQYGAGTVAAVKLYQSMVGLSPSGAASAALQEEIFSDNAPKYKPTPSPRPTATPEPQYIELSRGSSGPRVTRLQNRLRTLGYYSGTVDGDYGSATVNAVKLFQQAIGLKQSGTATVALQKKLFSSGAPYYVAPTPAPDPWEDEPEEEEENYIRLAPGSYGSQVKKLQQRLKALGYYTGAIDFDYGSSTAEAVKKFQRAIGVNETGVATVSLQRRLYASNAPAYEDEEEEEEEYTLLQPGDSGTKVKKLQRRLKELGYFSGEIGGNYLTQTTEAVKRFQKAIGVKVTGIATASLQRKLFSSSAPYYEEDEPEETPRPTEGYTVLQYGDSSEAVQRLQLRLKELGYFTGNASGDFGNRTLKAVKAFEARYGREQTGIATVALQKKLFSSSALPARNEEGDEEEDQPHDDDYATLKKGDSGAAVKKLQRRLKELGYFTGSIGGHYQQLTIEAVKRFQKAVGLKPSGTADEKTQRALFADNAPSYDSDSEGSGGVYVPLEKGDTGEAVVRLQERLIETGYIRDASDVKKGTFDKNTMLAVIDAQNDRGYDSDGVADVEFQTYLFSDEVWKVVASGSVGG